VPPLRVQSFILETLNSQFLVVFQSFVFRQILANFGSFGQFGANFVALVVADSMPKVWLKSLKPHNF
jgi:hypothetical protein